MKKNIIVLLFFLGIQVYGQQKPNIVYILADDMGWKDAGFAGSDLYETPNLDRLAKEGMIFTNAYAAAGNCTPSRACFVSGQYTPRHEVYAVGNTKRGAVSEMRLEPLPNSKVLPTSVYTIAEAMKDAGYKTAMFGKWHIGNKETFTAPINQGFDVDSTFKTPSEEEFQLSNDPKRIYQITMGACKFIEENKDGPFFLYLPHFATHMPIQARKEMYEKFKSKEGKYQKNKKYAAMNAQMDDGIGILLRKLKELDLEKNTLVIFTSDNGGLPESPQYPLRGSKGMYYEGGIRVPFIARWPGVIQPGSVQHTPIINVDIFATLVDITKVACPKAHILDGKSLLNLFKGKPDLEQRPLFWHFPGYLDVPQVGGRDTIFRSRPVTAIRKGDWKLLLFHEEWVLENGRDGIGKNNAVELYNLKDDIGETNNLVLKNPQKTEEMLQELFKMMEQTGAKMPTQRNPLYKPSTSQ